MPHLNSNDNSSSVLPYNMSEEWIEYSFKQNKNFKQMAQKRINSLVDISLYFYELCKYPIFIAFLHRQFRYVTKIHQFLNSLLLVCL